MLMTTELQESATAVAGQNLEGKYLTYRRSMAKIKGAVKALLDIDRGIGGVTVARLAATPLSPASTTKPFTPSTKSRARGP